MVAQGRGLTGWSEPSAFVQPNGNRLNRIDIEKYVPARVRRLRPRKDPVQEFASESPTPEFGRNPHSPNVILLLAGEYAGHSDKATV